MTRPIPLADFLGWFSDGVTGHIVKLQTTFMDIAFDRPGLPPLVRITYHSKRTFRLRHGAIQRVQYVRDHPMLAEFNPASDAIMFFDDAYVIGKGFTIKAVDTEEHLTSGCS